MSDNAYNYCCTQLQAALSDAPGGEKAWVPLRRSLVQTCLNNLSAAGAAIALMDELSVLLDQARVVANMATGMVVPPRDETWNELDRNGRVEAIRRAHETGIVPPYLPAPNTWRRHYPEAFGQPIRVDAKGGAHA